MKKRAETEAIRNSNRLIEELAASEVKKKELVSDYNYILWLEKFTLLYERFTDDMWLYRPEELSKEDSKNVENISLFFGALSEYCLKYHINFVRGERYKTESIDIRHNAVGYQIGLIVGQGAYVYVERKEPAENAIEFERIMKDIAPDDFEKKKALLQSFEQIVTEMKKIDVPTSAILEILNKN